MVISSRLRRRHRRNAATEVTPPTAAANPGRDAGTRPCLPRLVRWRAPSARMPTRQCAQMLPDRVVTLPRSCERRVPQLLLVSGGPSGKVIFGCYVIGLGIVAGWMGQDEIVRQDR